MSIRSLEWPYLSQELLRHVHIKYFCVLKLCSGFWYVNLFFYQTCMLWDGAWREVRWAARLLCRLLFILLFSRALSWATVLDLPMKQNWNTDRVMYSVAHPFVLCYMTYANFIMCSLQRKNKQLSYCWETVRRESMPRIAEMDVEITT